MNLNDAIARDIRRWPTLYACRTDVLHQWFCVNGNGMDWVNGRLVGYDSTKRMPSLKSRIADATEGLRTIQLSCVDDAAQAAKYRVLIRKEEDRVKQAHVLADDLARVSWDHGVFPDPNFAPARIYPLCEYARMNRVPDDVDPEYLAAVREMILEVFRSDPSRSLTPSGATAEQQAAAHQANIQFADRVLQDLARRFGTGSMISSHAQYQANRRTISQGIQAILSKLRASLDQ